MEIWQVQYVVDDGTPEQEPEYFSEFSLIADTLRTSYSTCTCVDIVKSPQPFGGPSYLVTGFLGNSDKPFRHLFRTRRITVHDRVTHL